jgi:hypothetical protein
MFSIHKIGGFEGGRLFWAEKEGEREGNGTAGAVEFEGNCETNIVGQN